MGYYQRAIFFTKSPLGGKYRYKDEFQIFPANLENLPKSAYQKHYPNILEYRINEEDYVPLSVIISDYDNLNELFSSTAISLNVQDRILDFLTAVTNNAFFRYTSSEGNWGMPMTKDIPDSEMNSWSSKWCMKLFHFPELPEQLKINGLTETRFDPIIKIRHKEFYTNDPNLDSDSKKQINLPDTIDYLLDSYFALSEEDKSIINSSISFTVSAIELFNLRKTLSLLASFTSMETMVNLEYKEIPVETCDRCGQQRYSIAKKFKGFLLKYIGDTEANKKKFNDYYSLRSKVIHTGRQLKSEKLFADIPEEEGQKDYLTRIEILQIGKLAITNWLLTKPYGVNK